MKKTSVMIEVSDDLYNDVVEPYKKKKGLGKLIVHLLEAYYTNESIHSYINGIVDGIENESTESLMNDLANMTQSLNMLGVLESQAVTVMSDGARAFNDIKVESVNPPTESLTREDVIKIVDSSVSDIKNMLGELLIDKNRSNQEVTVSSVEKVEVKKEEKIEPVVKPIPVAEVKEEKVEPIVKSTPMEEVEEDYQEVYDDYNPSMEESDDFYEDTGWGYSDTIVDDLAEDVVEEKPKGLNAKSVLGNLLSSAAR